MAKENLSVLLPADIRARVDQEARRDKRSRAAVVRDALELYFKLRGIGTENPEEGDRAAIAEGRQAYGNEDHVPLSEWRHAVGLGDR